MGERSAISEALHAFAITDDSAKAVGKILDTAAFRDTLVHSVCLVNESAGLVISNLSVPAAGTAFYDQGTLTLFQEFETNYDHLKNEVFFPRRAAITLAGQQKSRNYISMVFTEMTAGSPGQLCVIVNIDQARLSKLLQGQISSQTLEVLDFSRSKFLVVAVMAD